MPTKPADKPKVVKPPVDNSSTYIWILLIFTGIAWCTRINFSWVGNDRQAVAIDITSRIGKEDTGSNNLKNVIHLTIDNPFTTENLNRVREFVSGNKEVKGEFLDREFSIAPKSKAQPTPPQKTADNESDPDRQ
jgi:hypothetical protein